MSQQEFENTFQNEFASMTTIPTTHEELKNIRKHLPKLLLNSFTENERMFLIQLKSGNPDWSLLPIKGIDNLPGIQWKLHNINKISEEKKKGQLNKLKQLIRCKRSGRKVSLL